MYDINEDAVCFKIFKANDYEIHATNAKNSASALGVNKLTDLRQDKFAASYTGFKPVSRWSGLPGLSTHEHNRVPLVSSREESGAVQFLLVLFNNRRFRGCVGPQHWQSCVPV